jgi:outer membrane lipoprotein
MISVSFLKEDMMKTYLLTMCLLLVGCSNLPPAIEDPPLYDISYSEATRNIAHFKNAPVRWGGTVIDVENEQNFSLVQVLYYPLNSYGRPQLDKPNEGRFLIKSPDFLDPAVYTKNSEITVAGTLTGDAERAVGNKTLRLPMISAKLIHRWQAYVPGNYYGYGGFGYGYPYYGYYGYYPYYRGGFFGPYW